MNLIKNKRAFVQHPLVIALIMFLLGLVAAYLWINYTTIPSPFCPK